MNRSARGGSVKRFERSNGLDTVLNKTCVYPAASCLLCFQEDFESDGGDGASLEFYIIVDETGSCHKANVRRSKADNATTGQHHGLNYDLFVDGYMIIEHGIDPRPWGATAPPPFTTSEPPPYEFAVSDISRPDEDDKKTK